MAARPDRSVGIVRSRPRLVKVDLRLDGSIHARCGEAFGRVLAPVTSSIDHGTWGGSGGDTGRPFAFARDPMRYASPGSACGVPSLDPDPRHGQATPLARGRKDELPSCGSPR